MYAHHIYSSGVLVPLYLAQALSTNACRSSTRKLTVAMAASSLQRSFLDGRVQIVVADITQQSVDAIVNAANSSLMGGAGVDGAIHRAGGPAILEACRELRKTQYPDGLPTGEAVITTAGRLLARYVIHVVGPVYGQGKNEAQLLANCYHHALQMAVNHSLSSIAFPAISTGAYGVSAGGSGGRCFCGSSGVSVIR